LIYALFASILFAGWRSRRVPGLFMYFCMQALYTIATDIILRRDGETSELYAIVYAAGTGLILVVVAGVVYEIVLTKQNSSRGMVLAGVMAICTSHWLYTYLAGPVGYKTWIQVIEATVLLWAGLVLWGTAPYVERRAVSAVLALLWLSLAGWRWAFVLHVDEAKKYLSWNWQVPGWSCVAAFTIIGLLLHPLALHARR
jgi:hypothetical protein